MNVVEICEEHWKRYKNIRLKALKTTPYAFSTKYEDAIQRTDNSWKEQSRDLYNPMNGHGIIVEDKGIDIGLAVIYRTSDTQGEICQVYVDKFERNKGIGRKILDIIHHWCNENGIDTTTAVVFNENKEALLFYKNCGFHENDKTNGNGIVFKYRIGKE